MNYFACTVLSKEKNNQVSNSPFNLKIIEFPINCSVGEPWRFCIDETNIIQTSLVQKISCKINGVNIDCSALSNIKEYERVISMIEIETKNSIYTLNTVGTYDPNENKEDL